jgi:hydroxyacylglutathione hydrolase
MFFRQIFEEGLAQASYVVGCPDSEEALVVDPRRDIDVYLQIARENDLTINAISETHIHADFLSGARELAAATGATLHLSGEGGADWCYQGLPTGSRTLFDGDVIHIGDVAVDVLHTPGHTPEHLTFLVSEGAQSKGPMIAMTGDFVFVGDLGRPDLLESAVGIAGSAAAGGRAMFASLRDKFGKVPDYVQIWPGHGAGSACGKALGAVPASTVGYERLTAWWAPFLASGDQDGFVRELLDGQPDAPAYFARMKRLNRDGAPILGNMPRARPLDAASARAARLAGAQIVDARERRAFQASHFKNAISIPDEPTFSTRAAWFVAHEQPIVLIAKTDRVDALTRALIRVGLDSIAGYIPVDDVETLGDVPREALASIDVGLARKEWECGPAAILDVRTSLEYRDGHIPGAIHVPASRLLASLGVLPRDRPLLVHCAGGTRSSAAASALLAAGFESVKDMAGGFGAWRDAGNPVETGASVAAAR